MKKAIRWMTVATAFVTSPSCAAFPEPVQEFQCAPQFVYTTIGDINYIESACVCRKYVYSKEYIGPIGGESIEPIKSCDKMVGYRPKAYQKVFEYTEKVNEIARGADDNEKH